jgi:2-desacetyl-2-hydroxyethyl bacteriochlorophyllide A dehydrogenase
MKAAVFHGPRDIRIEEVAVPELEKGEVLVKVHACGICGSDLHAYQHGMFESLSMPVETGRVLGHEPSGEVVDINGEVPGIKIGDRVTASGIGGNAEFLRIPLERIETITRIPTGVSFEEAATVEPLATSLHAVDRAAPENGETHVIMGAGIIGLGILQVLRATAKVNTIVVDLSDKRLAMAQKLGADTIINAAREDAFGSVLKITGTEEMTYLTDTMGMADTVFDCAGIPFGFTGTPVLQQAVSMVKQNGKVVIVALFEKPAEIDYNIVVRKGISMLGSWAWAAEDFHRSMDMIGSGKIDRKVLITHQFPLDRAKEAYETQLKTDEAVKILLKPSE